MPGSVREGTAEGTVAECGVCWKSVRLWRAAMWTTVAIVMLVLVIVGAYRTGYVHAYCETKYGPDAQTEWTGWAGQNGECLIRPATPAQTEPVS